tara:strand:+ start:85778 stop:86503 length:726 start_codon:yes stop_codon:yes gene_type:complete
MKLRLTALILASAVATANAATTEKKMVLKDKTAKVSYSIGIDIGKSFNEQSIKLNEEAFLAGVRDGKEAKPSLMTDEEIRDTLLALQTEMVEKQKAEAKKVSMKNEAEGTAFLEKNKKREGIVTLPSGLQYKVLEKGKDGAKKPKATDTVTTHYRGKLIDGTEFDSSYSRGEPVSFAVNGVIPGWTEALQLMSPGAKWELFIPAKLAYGEQGIGGVIPPNATLTFEVELISIKDTAKTEKQ